ncbi:cilia- and flagella-associated protein 157-like [Oratosquilla oratoria]|uniref:cilia- and flagella-associated protein 157-like n=1 Tax=Oratosquilla oratoria TaxID=337810 RepID=UPI003F76BC38
MGPKKPKGGKKGAKKGAKKSDRRKEKEETEDKKDEISELDKHFYLNQIQALETKLERVSQRCKNLEESESLATTQLEILYKDKTDIVTFLKSRLSSRGDEVEELQNRLAGLLKAKQAEKDLYENKLAKLAKDAENTRIDLSDQIIALTRKLESLEEFKLLKDELEAKLARLEDQLKTSKAKHQEEVSVLERASLLEAVQMRDELDAKVARITEDLRIAARNEMHSTTRRALVENETLSKQMQVFRERLGLLKKENEELRNSLVESQMRESTLQDTIGKLTARSERQVRLLEEVTTRAEEHAHVWQNYDRLTRDNGKLQRDLKVQQAQLDLAMHEISHLKERVMEKDVALELTCSNLREADLVHNRLESTVRSALTLLQESTFREEDDEGKDLETTETRRPEALMEQLVVLLTAAEKSLERADSIEASEGTTSDSGFPRIGSRGLEGRRARSGLRSKGGGAPAAGTDGGRKGHLVSYKAGDLGLLPRVGRRNKNNISGDGK